MTTLTAPARTTTEYRLSFPGLLHSEWIKLSTLRSTWWSIGIVAVLTVGIALLMAASLNVPGFPPIQIVVSPIQFTMLLAGILGVISVTGEYSTGMIRSTFTAGPRRGSVLAAKAIVVGILLFVASLVIFFAAALAVSPVLAGKDMSIAWDSPADSLLPILAASLCMAIFAVIGVGIGFLLRSGAGAIAATVGLLFVLPIVVSIFPTGDPAWAWVHDLAAYLPMSASQNVIMPQSEWGLEAPVALLALGGWVAASMLAAWGVLRMRDA